MIGRTVLAAAVLAAVGSDVLCWAPATDARAAEAPTEAPPDVQDLVFLGPTRPVLVRLHVTIDGEPFRTVWRRRFDESFAAEDRDGDGNLSGAEAEAVAREMRGSLSDEGETGLNELAGHMAMSRAEAATLIEQMLPPLVVRPRGVVGQGAALAVFPLLDDDRDGQLSGDELAAAEKRLLLRDFDDNRVLTPGELIIDPDAIAEASDPDAQEKDLDADQSPVMLLAGAGPWPKFAERMLARYDRSGDGKLSTAAMQGEIALPPAILSRWDADGDGLLTASELRAARDWNPDMELKFALGTTQARRSRASRAPRNPDGFRVREKLLGGYDLDLHEAAIDFDRDNRDPRQADLIDFRNYDRDNNKYLDTSEAQAQGIGTAAFKAMDIDGDGKVFRGELTTYATRQNEAAAARLCLVVKDKGQDMFNLLQIETDGLLSQRELSAARSLLETHDTNGDGMLALSEVPQIVEMELVRGVDESAGPAMSYRFSVDNSKAQTSGPLWFRKMDRNNDGDLSPYEFIGPRSTFDRLDADGDGLVDRGEAESVAEPAAE